MPPDVSFSDIETAAECLHGVAHRTPVIRSSTLNSTFGTQVFLKCENLQRTGAFKFRGAYNRLAALSPMERRGGVVAFSSGNHAQGVALAGRLLSVQATIVMPEDASLVKAEAVVGYGAELIRYKRSEGDRGRMAETIARDRNATVISPFDDPRVIAGQGTAALELMQDVGDLDALLVPTSGGGLLAGCSIAATVLHESIAVYGVEPETGDDFAKSFTAGRPVTIPLPRTIADGLTSTVPGVLTLPIVLRTCAGILTVSDGEIENAMRFAFERLKLVLEPSGAAGLAALLSRRIDPRGKRVGINLSGGNVDRAAFARIMACTPVEVAI